MNGLTHVLKDRAILVAWIAGLVLITSLLWFLSFPFRSACLMNSTNKILASMNEADYSKAPRILSAPLLRPFSGSAALGCWYRLADSNSLFYVFVLMHGGILVPCGVEISEKGVIGEIIPLGSHARQVMGRIPQNLIKVYAQRIETSTAAVVVDSLTGGGR
jgi:hypothetical protein